MASELPVLAERKVARATWGNLFQLDFKDEYGQFGSGSFDAAWIKHWNKFLRDYVKGADYLAMADLKRFGQELFTAMFPSGDLLSRWRHSFPRLRFGLPGPHGWRGLARSVLFPRTTAWQPPIMAT